MSKGITVRDLLHSCQEQISKGNGDKIVLLSDDDELNGVHTAYYILTDDKDLIRDVIERSIDRHGIDEVVLLG